MKQSSKIATTNGIFGSPIFGEKALKVITAWRECIEVGFPEEVSAPFGGDDLPFVFGPRTQRTPIQLLDANDYQRKLKAIKKYTNTDIHCVKGKLVLEPLGEVELITAINLVLQAFSEIIDSETNQPVLWGLQLRDFDKDEAVMTGVPTHIKYLRTNMKAQRVIDLPRLFRLMCGFDPSLIFGAKGRYSSEQECVFLNDGNHGTITCVLHGVLTPPVGFSAKESPWIDNNQFIACGLDVLPLTHYDLWKNQVNRAVSMKEHGHEIKPEDLAAYNLNRVLSNCGVKLVPEAITNPGPKQCNQTANLQKHFSDHCQDEYENRRLLEAALKTVVYAWPGSAVDHAPVWGLIELYRCQPAKAINDNLIISVSRVLAEKWGSAKQVWDEVNKQIQLQYPKKDKQTKRISAWKDHRFTQTGNRGLMIGAAILTLLNNREEWIRSEPGKNKGFDLKLVSVTNKEGQMFEMDLPYTSKICTKNFTVFTATETKPSYISPTMDAFLESEEDEEEQFLAQVDDFENAE
jgi:hypothetical protein